MTLTPENVQHAISQIPDQTTEKIVDLWKALLYKTGEQAKLAKPLVSALEKEKKKRYRARPKPPEPTEPEEELTC